MIYFIQGKKTKLIKIGYTRHALQRMSQLQTGSPDVLELMGVKIGNKFDEKELHSEFVEYRVHGEWFLSSEVIVQYINKYCRINHSEIWMAEWAINEGRAGENYKALSQKELIKIGESEFRKELELSSGE